MNYDAISWVKVLRLLLMLGGTFGFFIYHGVKKLNKKVPKACEPTLNPEEIQKNEEILAYSTQRTQKIFTEIAQEKEYYSLNRHKVEKWMKQLSQLRESYADMKAEIPHQEMVALLDNFGRTLRTGAELIKKHQNPYQSGLINEESDSVVFRSYK